MCETIAKNDQLLDALERVQKTGIRLVDAYLAATAAETKLPVASFERGLDKSDVQRFEPKPVMKDVEFLSCPTKV